MMNSNVELLQWFITFLIKKTSGAKIFASCPWWETLATRNNFIYGAVISEIMLKQELAKELFKPTKKLEKRKVHSDVTGNIRSDVW